MEGRLGLADVRLRMQHYPQAEALFAAVAQVRSRERERERQRQRETERGAALQQLVASHSPRLGRASPKQGV